MILTGKDITKICSGLIHEPKQIGRNSLHLTVQSIKNIKSNGSVDFGGSEEESALSEFIEPRQKNPDDKYGWWSLSKGCYIIIFNEKLSIADREIALLLPLERLLKAGASLSPRLIYYNSEENINLFSLINVGEHGIDIKENARIAEAIVIRNA